MFNKNNYVLSSRRTISGISKILDENTLDRETLKREKTDKLFIGKVGVDSFYIISSSAIGVCCAVSGSIKYSENHTTEINIETRLPKTFITLFSVWTILTTAAFAFNIFKHGVASGKYSYLLHYHDRLVPAAFIQPL
jgi:hypothetical protein